MGIDKRDSQASNRNLSGPGPIFALVTRDRAGRGAYEVRNMREMDQLRACLHWAMIEFQLLAEYTKEDIKDRPNGARWWEISSRLLRLENDLTPWFEDPPDGDESEADHA